MLSIILSMSMKSKVDDAMLKDLINLHSDSMTKKIKIGYLLFTIVVWSYALLSFAFPLLPPNIGCTILLFGVSMYYHFVLAPSQLKSKNDGGNSVCIQNFHLSHLIWFFTRFTFQHSYTYWRKEEKKSSTRPIQF